MIRLSGEVQPHTMSNITGPRSAHTHFESRFHIDRCASFRRCERLVIGEESRNDLYGINPFRRWTCKGCRRSKGLWRTYKANAPKTAADARPFCHVHGIAGHHTTRGPRCHKCDEEKARKVAASWTDERRAAQQRRNARLDEDAVIAILESPHTDRFLAMVHGVCRTTIRSVRSGVTWPHIYAEMDAAGRINREGYAEMVKAQRQRAATKTGRVTRDKVVEILRSSEPQTVLAKRLNVSRGTVQNVRAGRTWRDVWKREKAAGRLG